MSRTTATALPPASRRLPAVLALVWLLGLPPATLRAQTVAVAPDGSALTVRDRGFSFIRGDLLARLKDGRTVRVDLELDVLPGPGRPAAAEARQTCVLSYDLWEERFAVAQAGAPSRSAAYLTAGAAEGWCVDLLAIPLAALGRLGREVPFWIRLGYRVRDADTSPPAIDAADYSLRGLVEALSRRRRNDPPAHAVQAGPFRLPR